MHCTRHPPTPIDSCSFIFYPRPCMLKGGGGALLFVYWRKPLGPISPKVGWAGRHMGWTQLSTSLPWHNARTTQLLGEAFRGEGSYGFSRLICFLLKLDSVRQLFFKQTRNAFHCLTHAVFFKGMVCFHVLAFSSLRFLKDEKLGFNVSIEMFLLSPPPRDVA